MDIQAKKQKKFNRDVLDYKNQRVYKWQGVPENNEMEVLDTSIIIESRDSSFEVFETELDTISPATPLIRTPRNVTIRSDPEHNTRHYTPRDRMRDNSYHRHSHTDRGGRSPHNHYNIPTHNRFSPLRNNRNNWDQRPNEMESNYHQRSFFPQGPSRNRPPRPYATQGYRGHQGNRRPRWWRPPRNTGDWRRGPRNYQDYHQEGQYQQSHRNWNYGQNWTEENRRPRNHWERENVQEENEEGRRKRRRDQ